MNLAKFCLFTALGATLWNTFLMWLGFKLEEHIDDLLKYRTPIDVTIAGLLVVGVVLWYWLHLKKPKTPITRPYTPTPSAAPPLPTGTSRTAQIPASAPIG